MTPTSHVAIIGGGAMGCATAYYLAKAGVSSHHHRERRHRNSGIRLQRRRTQSTARRRHTRPPPRPRRHVLRNAQRPRPDTRRRIRRPSTTTRPSHFVTVAFDDSDLPAMQETHDTFDAADGFKRPLARRIRPPRKGAAPQPRSAARHLRLWQRNPQWLRIHPRPRTRRRAQRRADSSGQSSWIADRWRPRNSRNPRRRRTRLRTP